MSIKILPDEVVWPWAFESIHGSAEIKNQEDRRPKKLYVIRSHIKPEIAGEGDFTTFMEDENNDFWTKRFITEEEGSKKKKGSQKKKVSTNETVEIEFVASDENISLLSQLWPSYQEKLDPFGRNWLTVPDNIRGSVKNYFALTKVDYYDIYLQKLLPFSVVMVERRQDR